MAERSTPQAHEGASKRNQHAQTKGRSSGFDERPLVIGSGTEEASGPGIGA